MRPAHCSLEGGASYAPHMPSLEGGAFVRPAHPSLERMASYHEQTARRIEGPHATRARFTAPRVSEITTMSRPQQNGAPIIPAMRHRPPA